MESFAPWLERLEKSIRAGARANPQRNPFEWYEDDMMRWRDYSGSFTAAERCSRAALAAKNTTRQPFPNWR